MYLLSPDNVEPPGLLTKLEKGRVKMVLAKLNSGAR